LFAGALFSGLLFGPQPEAADKPTQVYGGKYRDEVSREIVEKQWELVELRKAGAEIDRKPACVKACPTSARLFGDIHDPESEVSLAIREDGGYALMPEWGTLPANHYLPRRKTKLKIHKDELERSDNPLKVDGQLPKPGKNDSSMDDVSAW